MIINHIDLPYGFNVGSREPIDARFILSKADMAKVGDATQGEEFALARWPYHYFVLCEDDGQIYEFRHNDATCSFTRLTRKIDERTIVEDSETLTVRVPIDELTIVVNSEGKLSAVPEPLVDGIATKATNLADGSAKVDVVYDPLTLVVALNNELGVKFDHDTIQVDSEGLFVDFAAHVDNVTIKYDSEKLVAQYKADEEKGLHLDGVTFGVKVDNNSVKFNSEGKLTASFLRYEGEHGIEVTSEGKIKALTDDATIKVVNDKLEVQKHGAIDSDVDGLFVLVDQHTIKTSEGARPLRVPIHDLIHSSSEAILFLDKSVDDELTLKIRHDETLVETPQGLHVVARQAVASEGIIVVPEGETSIISADFDHKTIVLGSEGMEVNIMPNKGLKLATGAGGAPLGLKVDVDEVTINYNSEGKLVSTSTPLEVLKPLKKRVAADGTITLDIGYDKKTIKLDNSELYVPIDEDTIIISEGVIKAKKQLFTDEETILEDSEHVLHVNIDKKTIIYNPDKAVVETAIGGWKEDEVHHTYLTYTHTGTAPIFNNVGGTIYEATFPFPFSEIPLDSAKVDVDLDVKVGTTSVIPNHLFEDYDVIDYGTTIEISGNPTDELVSIVYDKSSGNATVRLNIVDATQRTLLPLADTVVGLIDGDAANFHQVDAHFIPVDNTSIVIRGGKLVTSAPSITAGEGLKYTITPAANVLDVVTDSETIKIRDDKLYIPILADHTSSEQDLVLAINSEGKPEFLKRAGVIDVQLEGQSLVDNYIAEIPVATDSELGVVKFDNDTIVLNSEGQLKVVRLVEDVLVKEITSEGTSEESVVLNREAHIDLTPYSKLDETGYRVRLLVDGIEAPSEGVYDSESNYIITAELYDQAGNLLTTSNVMDLPIEHAIAKVSSRQGPADSEGIRETILVFETVNGAVYEVPLGQIMGGFVRQHADYLGTNSIDGRWDFANELYNHGYEVVTQIQFDEANLTFNDSENYVELIPYVASEGIEIVGKTVARTNKAGDTIHPTEYTVKAKFDHETIVLNSEDEMSVPIDKKTLVLDAGKLVANIDKKTIVYDDSEGHIELPLDNVTVFINSEGLLEAAGMDVKPGDAIQITTSEEAGLPVKYLDVLFDNESVKLNSENQLFVPIDKDSIIINSEALLEVHQYTVAEIRALWHAICSEGEA